MFLTYLCDNKRHLICTPYSIANLHQMAVDLDIHPCWFHGGKHPHYDIPKLRGEDIKKVCKVVNTREIFRIIHG